jgi:hypothetical protein
MRIWWVAALLGVAGSAQAGAAPDLEGDWTTSTLTPYARPAAFKSLVATEAEAAAYERKHRGRPPDQPQDAVGGAETDWWETDVGLTRIGGQARTSWIVSPADGRVPFTTEAQASNQARRARAETDFAGPEARPEGERCLASAAPPMISAGANDGFKIVQTPDAVVILVERSTTARIVRLDGSPHGPASIRTRNGESIGRWEGATLVIETRNFADATVPPAPGDDRSQLRVTERITRTGPGALHYAFSLSNPSRYVQPVEGEMVFRPSSRPMFEVACHEGNYALRNILAGARVQEAAPPEDINGVSDLPSKPRLGSPMGRLRKLAPEG